LPEQWNYLDFVSRFAIYNFIAERIIHFSKFQAAADSMTVAAIYKPQIPQHLDHSI